MHLNSGRSRLHITCMMIVSALSRIHATYELRPDAMSDRPRPRPGRRMVEHHDFARCLSRPDAVRRIPEEPRYRPQYAGQAAQFPGRGGIARTPAIQRKATAL